VHTSTFAEHLVLLDRLLRLCANGGPKLGLPKCTFASRSAQFLGFVVSANGVRIDETRRDAIAALSAPHTVGELRSLLGFLGYLRRFVPRFAELASPMSALLVGGSTARSSARIQWPAEAAEALEKIKAALSVAPTLAHAYTDETHRLELHTDASDIGIGAALMCVPFDRPSEATAIEFFSRKLTSAERNYSVTDREALALVKALIYWRPILFGRHVDVFTDHNVLRFLLSARDLRGRLARWVPILQEFQLTIRGAARRARCAVAQSGAVESSGGGGRRARWRRVGRCRGTPRRDGRVHWRAA
jgi:hypothetical protein